MLKWKAFNRTGYIAFSPNGSRLVACGWHEGVRLFDSFTGQAVWSVIPDNKDHWHGVFTPDGKHVVLLENHRLLVLDARDGREIAKHSRSIAAFHLMADSQHILAVTSGMDICELRLLELLSGKILSKKRLTYHGGFSRLRLSPDERTIGAIGNTEAMLADAGTKKVSWYQREDGLHDGRSDATFSPDGSTFVYSVGGKLHVRDLATGERRTTPRWRGSTICEMEFTKDGRHLYTVNDSTSVAVWDTTTWTVAKSYQWKAGRLTSIAMAPDGNRAAAASENGHIIVWDLDE